MSGLYNVYNTNAVLLLIKSLINIKIKDINKWLKEFVPTFGRQEEIIYKNRKVFILLSKNPAGFNQSIQTVREMIKNKRANFLIVLNNKIPDGLDVSWIWDVDFKPIFDVANNVYVSGDRVYDINLRLKYENSKNSIDTFEDLSDAVESIINKTKEEERLFILPTYSAMLEVRKILLGRKLL
jgi:UDP-N-acetylmuramyl tripeptide synthase